MTSKAPRARNRRRTRTVDLAYAAHQGDRNCINGSRATARELAERERGCVIEDGGDVRRYAHHDTGRAGGTARQRAEELRQRFAPGEPGPACSRQPQPTGAAQTIVPLTRAWKACRRACRTNDSADIIAGTAGCKVIFSERAVGRARPRSAPQAPSSPTRAPRLKMSTKPADAERRSARLSPEEQRRNAAAVRARRAVRRRESKLHHAMKSAQAEMAGMDELIGRLSDWNGMKRYQYVSSRRPIATAI